MRQRLGYYNKQGQPISQWEYMELYADFEKNCRVAENIVYRHGVKIGISTVWLGLDHNHDPSPDAKPLIFETMMFGGPDDRFQHRWHTQIDAIRAHEAIVAAVEDTTALPFANTNMFVPGGLVDRVLAMISHIDEEHGK